MNKKSRIPYIFVFFFLVIFVVNFIYIYISKTTWRGVVSNSAYQDGLEYNKIIKHKREQDLYGWNVKVKYDNNIDGILKISVKDQENKIIKDAKILVNFVRPITEGSDFEIIVPFNKEKKIYEKQILFPHKGQWEFKIKIIQDNKNYNINKKYIIY